MKDKDNPSKAETPKENSVLKTILDNSESDKGIPVEKLDMQQFLASRGTSINSVLVSVPDEQTGDISMDFPVIRDPETRKMTYRTQWFKIQAVPPNHVAFFTGKEIKDRNNAHADSVEVDRVRMGFIFDRTYTYHKKVYTQCCWIPDEKLRAGVMFEKKVHRQTRRPIAILKKLKGAENMPAYQIVGAKEPDYRDLRRIFERYFLKPLALAEDEDLSKFTYDSFEPIPEEVAG